MGLVELDFPPGQLIRFYIVTCGGKDCSHQKVIRGLGRNQVRFKLIKDGWVRMNSNGDNEWYCYQCTQKLLEGSSNET